MPLILKDACRDEMVVIRADDQSINYSGTFGGVGRLGKKKCGVGNGDPKSPLPTPSPRFCGR